MTFPLWGRRLIGPFAAALIAGSAAIGLQLHRPPAPVDEGRADAFSLRRAMTDVGQIATGPRVPGSRASANARAYILAELRRLDLAPIEQYVPVLRRYGAGRHIRMPLRNLLARIEGRTSNRAVLLMAHYDSVHAGPGAADDASGVATLLETARVLRRGPPLGNDVILLFTDGEEFGLAGADAFIAASPWARDVAVAINFEARGTSGPSLLFESPGDNGWVIRQFAKSAAFPRASSLYDEIYRVMGHGTDLDLFRDRGVPGLNFAFVELPGRYHTSGDTPAALDTASLHHHGVTAVSLVRTLGNADLSDTTAPDAVYFTLGNWVFVYSSLWQWGSLLAAAVLLVAQLSFAARYRDVAWRSILASCVVMLVTILLAAAAAFGVSAALAAFVPVFSTTGLGLYVNTPIAIGIVLVCLAVMWGMVGVMRRRASGYSLMLGGAIVGLLGAGVLAAGVPGAAYPLIWSSLMSILASAVLLRRGDRAFWGRAASDVGPSRPSDTIVSGLFAAPSALLVAPIVFVLYLGLGMGAAVPVAVLVSFALVLMAPALIAIAGAFPWRACLVAAALAAIAIAAGILNARIDREWPQPSSVFYARSLDEGRAVWATREPSVDEWTAAFVGRTPKRGLPLACLSGSLAGSVLYGSAPLMTLAEPNMTFSRTGLADGRTGVSLSFHSQDGATVTIRNLSPRDAGVRLADVGGVPVDGRHKSEPFDTLNARTEPGEPLVIRFETVSPGALRFAVLDTVDELPQRQPASRPAWIVRGTAGSRLFNETSVTCRTMVVDPPPVTLAGARAADVPAPRRAAAQARSAGTR